LNENKQNNEFSKSPSLGGARGSRIIIAGGGTGGHIFPAIAIANALKQMQPNIQILFVGATGKMEMEKVPQAGYEIKGLDIAGFNRSSLIKNIGLPFKLVKSFFQVSAILKEFRPNAVIGVGGYSTFPVLKSAQRKGIPTFIHESNSFAGKANMMLGKNATKIFVASAGMEKFFPSEKLLVTGNPVRRTIAYSTVSKSEGIRFFGLDESKKTVLAVGGSLGARSINEALTLHINEFEQNDLQLIWQTGKTTATEYKAMATGKQNIWCSDFITQMEMAYAAADMVISRAGAMAVTELCVAGKPSIFVPFPLAAEDHQTANAKTLVDKQAAMLIKDSEAKEKLVSIVVELSKNEDLQKWLSANIASLAIKNADEIIAKEILKFIE
jgi:UDP-N-acetylglucosamine--N-acetylmuramyl-(pentapeptide) pyrophosphoryl-undecaprenol N-acetylglucosamine transferase